MAKIALCRGNLGDVALGGWGMRFAVLTLVTSLYAFGVMAQTSPDGSSITAPGSAQLVA